MALDEAAKAHVKKEETVGEVFPAHSVFTEGDVELRTLQDKAEAARQEAYQAGGYVAAPGVGDYHAVRREAKHAGALLARLGTGSEDDPSEMALEAGVREGIEDAMKDAGQARRNAGAKGTGPTSRRTRSEVMGVNATTGGTGGLVGGGAEGSGKSASTTGTDTTDRGMDASVGDQPANPQLDGIDPTGQDRPATQEESVKRQGRGTGRSAK